MFQFFNLLPTLTLGDNIALPCLLGGMRVADATARVFLGLQMGCAECHDHPFGQWSREEFWNYTAFFADVAAMQDRAVFGRVDFAVEQVVRGPVSPLVIPNTSTVARPQFPGAKEIMPKGDKPDRDRLAGTPHHKHVPARIERAEPVAASAP